MLKNDKPVFRFRGGKRTVEETTRRSKRSSGGYDSILDPDIPMFKPKEGENCIRILPPTWQDDKWGNYWDIEVFVHYDVGAQGGSYLCLDKMNGEGCPVCEAAREAADKDEARSFRPVVRALCWLIDRNDEKAGPQVWSMPNKMYKEINARSQDKKTKEVILIDGQADGLDGYDVTFTRQGTKKETDYSGVEISREMTPLHDDERIEERWMKYIEAHPLPDILQFYDTEYIEKVLMGRVEPKREEETEEEEPASSRRRTSRVEGTETRPAALHSPEPEEEVEDEEVEEAEKHPPPRARHTRRDVEENDEEAEPDAPSPRRARRQDANEEKEADAEKNEGTERVSAGARRSLDRLKARHVR